MSNIIVLRDADLSDSSDSIDPMYLKAESEALIHHVFGTDWADFSALTDTDPLVESGTATVNANSVDLTKADSLITSFSKANDFTFAMVGKYLADTSGIWAGNRTTSGAAGMMFYGRASANKGIQFVTSSNTLNLDFDSGYAGGWIFLGVSVSVSEVRLYSPQSSGETITGLSSPSIGELGTNMNFGSVNYSTTVGDDLAEIAEAMIFDRSLSLEELRQLYERSKSRMSDHGISI